MLGSADGKDVERFYTIYIFFLSNRFICIASVASHGCTHQWLSFVIKWLCSYIISLTLFPLCVLVWCYDISIVPWLWCLLIDLDPKKGLMKCSVCQLKHYHSEYIVWHLPFIFKNCEVDIIVSFSRASQEQISKLFPFWFPWKDQPRISIKNG